MSLAISYGLPSDIILGSDWALPCQLLFASSRPYVSRAVPETIEALPPSHGRNLVEGSLFASHQHPSSEISLSYSKSCIITSSQHEARDVLSLLLGACCNCATCYSDCF